MDDHLSRPLRADRPEAALERRTGDEPGIPGSPGAGVASLVDEALITVLRDGYGPVVGQLIDLFEAGTPPLIAELQAAWATRDDETLRRVGHQLKGSCRSIGASFMAALAENLELGLGSAGDVDRLQAAFDPTAQALRIGLLPPT